MGKNWGCNVGSYVCTYLCINVNMQVSKMLFCLQNRRSMEDLEVHIGLTAKKKKAKTVIPFLKILPTEKEKGSYLNNVILT